MIFYVLNLLLCLHFLQLKSHNLKENKTSFEIKQDILDKYLASHQA